MGPPQSTSMRMLSTRHAGLAPALCRAAALREQVRGGRRGQHSLVHLGHEVQGHELVQGGQRVRALVHDAVHCVDDGRANALLARAVGQSAASGGRVCGHDASWGLVVGLVQQRKAATSCTTAARRLTPVSLQTTC